MLVGYTVLILGSVLATLRLKKCCQPYKSRELISAVKRNRNFDVTTLLLMGAHVNSRRDNDQTALKERIKKKNTFYLGKFPQRGGGGKG